MNEIDDQKVDEALNRLWISVDPALKTFFDDLANVMDDQQACLWGAQTFVMQAIGWLWFHPAFRDLEKADKRRQINDMLVKMANRSMTGVFAKRWGLEERDG